MNTPETTSRREFLKNSGKVAAASAVAGSVAPRVFAAGSDEIRIALIGCGGRGTGAAVDAMSVKSGPVKLVAMADLFENRLSNSYNAIKKSLGEQVDVPEERKFVGFDAYKQAMDCLRPGDIAIFATPPVFRWVHFSYAIKKNLNVFMEKPLTADGPTSRRMLRLADEATSKNLKVGVGLMSRHSRAMQELHNRIQDGEIGEIILMRGYRTVVPLDLFFSTKWPGTPSELLWQIKRFHSFIWASGGGYNDSLIHIIDHCCWMKDAWPVKAHSLGGRQYRTAANGEPYVDQNFDTYATEYTFADGSKFMMDSRFMVGCFRIFNSCLQGTKGSAICSKSSDCGLPSSTHSGQIPQRSNTIWKSRVARGQTNPYRNEWNDLVEAIRSDTPYNEAHHGVMASVVSNMGRKAAHTGQEISFEEMLNCEQEYAPDVDKLTLDSPAPLQADADGKYPVPMPGITTDGMF